MDRLNNIATRQLKDGLVGVGGHAADYSPLDSLGR
jgi:hypothetical protein